jgi:hypothetical protein
MTSGEPSGLRVRVWKSAPETASAEQHRGEHARQAPVDHDRAHEALVAGQRPEHLADAQRVVAPGHRHQGEADDRDGEHRGEQQGAAVDAQDALPEGEAGVAVLIGGEQGATSAAAGDLDGGAHSPLTR